MNLSIIAINATTTDADIDEMVALAGPAERLKAFNIAACRDTKKFASAQKGIAQTIGALRRLRDSMVAEAENAEPAVEPELTDAEVEVEDAKDAELIERFGVCRCPSCGVGLDNGVIGVMDVESKLRVDMTHEFECLGCGANFGRERSKARSAGVAESWKDPEVAAKRRQRNAVEVDGLTYRSVRAAFIALELPLKRHIQFRMMLKEAGELVDEGRTWKIVSR